MNSLYRLVAATTFVLMLFSGITNAKPAQEQTAKSAPAVAGFQYEVATIKPDKSGNAYWSNTADGFSTSGTPAASLIRSAYGLLMPEQIVGLPG
jgi:hypothetical protein